MTVRMMAEVESRETPRCEFRLSMARRHEEHEAIDASRQQPLKLLGNQAMAAGGTIAGKCVFRESVRLRWASRRNNSAAVCVQPPREPPNEGTEGSTTL